MKIGFENVHYNVSNPGGPNNFAIMLASALQHNGHDVTIVTQDNDCDVYLCIIEQHNKLRDNIPMVLRLDGIYFAPDDFATKNVLIRETYNRTNGLVFQSEFDKTMIEKHFGSRNVPKRVIRNGNFLKRPNDETLLQITWLNNVRNDFDIVFVASSHWEGRSHKRLDGNINFCKQYAEWSKQSCVLLTLGVSSKFEPKTEHEHNENFTHIHIGPVPSKQSFIPICFADMFVHLAFADHCPNVVVEALSLQVPVVHSSFGGTAELVNSRGVRIEEMNDYNFELFNYKQPPKLRFTEEHFRAVQRCIGHKIKYEHVQDVNIMNVMEQYLELFNEVI